MSLMRQKRGKMQRNSNFALFNIAGIPYLLPFGQGIADHKRGVRINETGLLIWELLAENRTEKELLDLYASHFEASDSELPQMEADLLQYLQMLDNLGILSHDTAVGCNAQEDLDTPFNSPVSTGDDIPDNTDEIKRYLSIGGLTLLLRGPKEAFAQEFDAFEIPPASHDSASHDSYPFHVDQTITVVGCAPSSRPSDTVGGTVLLHNPELAVIQGDLYYKFLFPAAPGIYEAHLSINGTNACYYCCPPYTESLRYDLFHAIRLSFLYLAQRHDRVVLHSASLLYRDLAWLFSGVSGIGKSTHTNLWRERFQVPLINGDLNLLAWENGEPVIQGTPWCGTSKICDPGTYPLGGIILLKQAPVDRLEELSADAKRLLVLQRLISPSWTPGLYDCNLQFLERLADRIYISRLHCTKEFSAAETMKKGIDEYLDSQSLK